MTFASLIWTLLWLSHAGWQVPFPTAPTAFAAEAPSDSIATALTADTQAPGFSSGLSDFAARFGDQEIRYQQMAVFALPNQDVPVEVPNTAVAYVAEADGGSLRAEGPNRWTWRSGGDPGVATLRLRDDAGHTMTLHAFTLVPYAEMKSGKVRGYRVGAYPQPSGSRAAHSPRPQGFVEVTPATQDLAVSPHFRLGQFVCKEGSGFPKYIVVQPALLVRLENLLAQVNARGIAAETFTVMSAYRTPQYNRAIGNTTSFTRHQYGDAADIYVDASPVDGRMDDLNGDGRFDKKDALVLHRWAEEVEGTPEAGGLEGGLSAYSSNHAHGPFVHIDTRGYQARW